MMGSPGAFPGYPGGYPGNPPCHCVGYPRFPVYPGNPLVPIITDPVPGPTPDPGTNPTIPVGLPRPEVPDENSLDYWSPWPLPPRKDSSTGTTTRRPRVNGSSGTRRSSRTLQVSHQGETNNAPYRREPRRRGDDVRRFDLIDDASPTPAEDLSYHGGRVIRDLFYVNLFVSGDTEWSQSDVENIDGRLSAAMRDEHLNNVLLQYFGNQPIRSTPLPSHPLVGYTPKTVSRGDIQNMITWLYGRGFLESFNLQNTVFNLLLPPGTVLTVDDQAAIVVHDELASALSRQSTNAVPPYEDGDSLAGLGGYHGSVVTETNDRVYYTVSVYSERGANNTTNGIPVFREPWKNVVATLYHQLAECRTNPDVEEAMRHESDGTAEQYLGWVTASGLELGDFPIRADIPLRSVFQEVPLANGDGTVPVQFIYSNAVHGPEGPISQPHPLR